MPPSLDTFTPPVSPSHVATTAGITLAATLPGITANLRGIIVGGIVIAYTLGECVFASIKAKKITIPATQAQYIGTLSNDELDAIARMRGQK